MMSASSSCNPKSASSASTTQSTTQCSSVAAPAAHSTLNDSPPPPPTNSTAPPPSQQQQHKQTPAPPPLNSQQKPSSNSTAAVALGVEQLFHLRAIVQRCSPRICRSAYARDARHGGHLFCLLDTNDQLLLHHSPAYGPAQPRCVRTVHWFREQRKRVQDLCFDGTGAMLLVLCYENTLHTVPVAWVLDGQPSFEHFHLAADRITSFVVPFAGPHNCPNSKTCPNNLLRSRRDDPTDAAAVDDSAGFSDNSTAFTAAADALMHQQQWSPLADAFDDITADDESTLLIAGDVDTKPAVCSMDPCPFPTAVVWWQTLSDDGKQRAIVGYSDGSVCIVGLEPHCPLVAHTRIERGGGVVEMVICRDSLLSNVTLMITARSREQWKLMLEQKSTGFTYPGAEKELYYSASSSRQSSKESHDLPPAQQHTTTTNNDHNNQQQPLPSNRNVATLQAESSAFDDWQLVVPLNRTAPSAVVGQQHIDGRNIVDLSSSTCSVDSLVAVGASAPSAGILPSARARLVSLKELGAKKIGALKLKLAENRTSNNRLDGGSADPLGNTLSAGSDMSGITGRRSSNLNSFAIIDAMPVLVPERLTTAGGPFFIVQQQLGGKCVLSALHEHSDTLSLHSIDVSPIPLCIYKVPVRCKRVLVTPHLMYTVSEVAVSSPTDGTSTAPLCTVSVIGTGMAELRIGEEADLQISTMLGRFDLAADERIVAVYRMDEPSQNVTAASAQSWRRDAASQLAETINNNYVREMRYMREARGKRASAQDTTATSSPPPPAAAASTTARAFADDERRFLRTEFPELNIDGCLIITNRSAYVLELRESGLSLFCSIARRGGWSVCEEFCRTFRLPFFQCVEFAGDEMLRAGDTRQALQCYNVARIPSVKTALKLAMFGENNALMHLCAMALKTLYVLKSSRPLTYHIQHLAALHDSRFVGVEKTTATHSEAQLRAIHGAGLLCTDFSYEKDEAVTDLQMSNSSQFHLSNLLLLTLTERTIKDKKCMPLWNFLVTNKKYHPNMTSIVLCQSGLYFSAVLLACARGAHLDAFCGLVGVSNQEFGWFSEVNKIMTNLAEPMFMECIIYMYTVSQDYFAVVQNRMAQIDLEVLEKLRLQLDPFSAVFRPVVSQLDLNSAEVDPEFVAFCKSFIETFLLLIIHIQSRRHPQSTASESPTPSTCATHSPSISRAPLFANALSTMLVTQRHAADTQFVVSVPYNSPLSAGFSHCACIVDGVAYAWGSNGINCQLGASAAAQPESPDAYSTPRPLHFLAQLNLVVHAVRCGRTHTLILTNNGLYATGANQLGQLGIGMYAAQALQPMLVRSFDGRNITLMEAGQYHNAVLADGRLYTWGWGVYGQLGHNDVDNVFEPQPVAFFEDITVRQFSLGHAHTIVLGTDNRTQCDHIYVFGSNHYGQLGIGQPSASGSTESAQLLKSLVPLVLNIAKPIRLIHTKFFTNFIITDDNELYVWGASPQALRLQYQARKRAKASQKQDAEAAAAANAANTLLTHINDATEKDSTERSTTTAISETEPIPTPQTADTPPSSEATESSNKEHAPRSKSLNDLKSNAAPATTPNENTTPTVTSTPNSPPIAHQAASSLPAVANEEATDGTDHLYPQRVDTTEVNGQIVRISSGLYHSALITDQRTLHTWGKNLEKQLGRDRSQLEYIRPSPLDTIADVVHVECGADFTVCMCADLTVRAFGNSSFGQCGRDIAADKNGIIGKLVRLRISKRVVRIPDSTQCVEYPVNVALPRPQINMSHEPVRYLRRVPQFERRMVVRSALLSGDGPTAGNQNDDDGWPTALGSCADTPMEEPMAPIADAVGSTSDADLYPNEFIHYCLFLFHGVYDAQTLLDRVVDVEYRVRILLLNYNVKEAFVLCLQQSAGAAQALRTFEHFTKDASIVPLQRDDLKCLIYELFAHFMASGWSLRVVEQLLLKEIDHYLFALAYVLFFNNNNTDIERQVLAKFTDLFADELNYNSITAESLERSEQIFAAVSTEFKAIVCQKLFEYEDNFA